jgi:hypothetical protein
MMRRFPHFAAFAPLTAMLVVASSCSFLDPLNQSGLGIIMSPPDTALYVGAHLRARGLMVNSYGDLYPSAHLRYAGLDSSASVEGDGTVTGIAYGRARVVVTREQLADTSWVSVVPTGTLAVSTISDQPTFYVVNADGSGLQAIAPAVPFTGSRSAWLPGNAGLVYEAIVPGPASGIQLIVDDLAGHSRQLVPLGQDPRVSRDGSWVYFVNVLGGGSIWRVHADDGGLEQITPTPGGFTGDGDPDPLPDGTQLVYWSTRFPGGGSQLVVRVLASGAERLLGVEGQLPRWAPSGNQIAYWSGNVPARAGAILVINADGTGAHQVSAAGRNYQPQGLDWSPDGQWLLARADSTLDLIHVATGLTLPLGYSADYYFASWRW